MGYDTTASGFRSLAVGGRCRVRNLEHETADLRERLARETQELRARIERRLRKR